MPALPAISRSSALPVWLRRKPVWPQDFSGSSPPVERIRARNLGKALRRPRQLREYRRPGTDVRYRATHLFVGSQMFDSQLLASKYRLAQMNQRTVGID